MIQFFLTGGIFRFALRFISSVFERIVDVISEHYAHKRAIEHDRMKLENAQINSSTEIYLSEIKCAIEELKADQPISQSD